jgi:hypothetical protein
VYRLVAKKMRTTTRSLAFQAFKILLVSIPRFRKRSSRATNFVAEI